MDTLPLTRAQFVSLDWRLAATPSYNSEFHDRTEEFGGTDYIQDAHTGVYVETPALNFESWVAGGLEFVCDAPELRFHIHWMAQGGSHSYRAAYDFKVELDPGPDYLAEMIGFRLVEDHDAGDLDPVFRSQRFVILCEVADRTSWREQVTQLIPTCPTPINPDTNTSFEESDMEQFTVRRDNDRDLRFTGTRLGHIQSTDGNAGRNSSGSAGRWTELALYRTTGGKYICEQIGRTQWEGEHTRYKGAVCETIADVMQFFGHGWLAKGLYAEAGVDTAQDIE